MSRCGEVCGGDSPSILIRITIFKRFFKYFCNFLEAYKSFAGFLRTRYRMFYYPLMTITGTKSKTHNTFIHICVSPCRVNL